MGAAQTDPPGGASPSSEDRVEVDGPASGDASRLKELESRFEEMTRLNERLAQRLEELESRPSAPRPTETKSAPKRRAPAKAKPKATAKSELPEGFGGWAAIAGRLFLILGGAYLLRALAESGTLAFSTGVMLAAVYALFWLGIAHRGTSAGKSLDRTVYGLAFVLVAFPLIIENTNRFHLLSPSGGALALGVATALGLGVTWKHSLRLLAWILLLAAMSAVTLAAIHTQAWPSWMLLVVGIGIGIDWVAQHRKWMPVRVFAAGATDLALLLYLPIVLVDRDHYAPTVTLVQLSLFLVYMGSYLARTFARKHPIGTFERIQLSAVLLIGYVGAVLGAGSVPSVAVPLGWASIAGGVVGFSLCYVRCVRKGTNPVDTWFNTSYALIAVLVGSWVLMPVPAYAWLGIAILLTLVGASDRHACLALHGTLFAVFAAAGSGLMSVVGYAFTARATSVWPLLSVPALAALATLVLAYLAPLESEATRQKPAGRAAKTLSLAVLLMGLDGVVVALIVPTGEAGMTADWLAALRTGLIAGSALLLAALSRTRRFREARALVYPLLVIGGIKIVLEDFQHGRALTLFIACALYGAALIVAPRLRRKTVFAD